MRKIYIALSVIFKHTIALGSFHNKLSIGFDFGTSGARAIVIDATSQLKVHDAEVKWSESEDSFDASRSWTSAVDSLLSNVPAKMKENIIRICVSGTSATCMLVDRSDHQLVTRGPAMYDYNTLSAKPIQAQKSFELIKSIAPGDHTTLSGTSALMKLLTWHFEKPLEHNEILAHQADFIASYMCDQALPITSDWNNALKTGFDIEKLVWPAWILNIEGIADCLPNVIQPGSVIGSIGEFFSQKHGISHHCKVVAGTTDSIAAFLAAKVHCPGEAVTSLGSTMAIKLLSTVRIEDSSRGVYSHRLGDGVWLVGGASNVGCAVFRHLGFSDKELKELSESIDQCTGKAFEKVYYPLAGNKGERFPYNDPNMESILSPVPSDRGEYLGGLMHSISRIEKESYDLLYELGAEPKVSRVYTSGGGAKNKIWTQIRQTKLGIPVNPACNLDAAYGAALLGIKELI